jgi:hypothetical protein
MVVGEHSRDALDTIAHVINRSYAAQIKEGMEPLYDDLQFRARKYCGSGWGGYALYMFWTQFERDEFCNKGKGIAIEPHMRPLT